MAITTTATVIAVESAAKHGTLGSQAGMSANQVKLDTTIATNNGNLAASPTLARRLVVIRRGQTNEETGAVTSVDADGLTCTCLDNWDIPPSTGDSYYVCYTPDDTATIAGCTKEALTRQYAFTKRLVIGDGTNFAYFGIGLGHVLRFADSGPTIDALRVRNAGRFDIGTLKGEKPTLGGVILFTNDVDGEVVMTLQSGSIERFYDFTFVSCFKPDGVNLAVTKEVGAGLSWARGKVYGITPKLESRFYNFGRLTKGQIVGSPMWNGWLKSEFDQKLVNALTAETDDAARVRILIEDA
jgi:hypothetical protein